jgi:GNAT superfamily N-acetyltransferase
MPLTYRPGSVEDAPAVYDVFVETTIDLERRMGLPDDGIIWLAPGFVASYWQRRQTLFEHLARTADLYWVAEVDGQIVGFARSSVRDGVRELLEFFVRPAFQGQGIGGELLRRAFMAAGARRRAIIATREMRALARYMKAGVYPRFPNYYIYRKPEPVEVATDLAFMPVADTPETLDAIRAIDQAILGFTRDVDHQFLLRDRQAILFRRAGEVVGYGYFGKGTGPIALLDTADFPAVLAWAESEAAARGDDEFGMQLPLVNRHAVDHLLGRGFQLEDFTVFFMSDEPFGRFENYIFTSPPFFM